MKGSVLRSVATTAVVGGIGIAITGIVSAVTAGTVIPAVLIAGVISLGVLAAASVAQLWVEARRAADAAREARMPGGDSRETMVDQSARLWAAWKDGNRDLTVASDVAFSSALFVGSQVTEVRSEAGNLHRQVDASGETVRGITSLIEALASQTHEQVAAVEESSAAVEEMLRSVERTAQVGREKQEQTGRLVRTAREAADQLEETTASFQRVGRTVERMREIVSVINTLAEQTNLLSMNAAIEAAHAGEHGRGFAVVAEEVRKLADESAQNLAHVYDAIDEIERVVGDSRENIGETVRVFERVFDEVETSGKDLQEIVDATESVAAGGAEIRLAVRQLSDAALRIDAAGHDLGNMRDAIVSSVRQVFGSTTTIEQRLEDVDGSLSRISEALRRLGDVSDRLAGQGKAVAVLYNLLHETSEADAEDLTLRAQMEAINHAGEKANAAAAALTSKALKKLVQDGFEDRVLRPGAPAPRFRLRTITGTEFDLQSALARGPVVLNFYRGSWCPYCNLELQAYARILPDIRKLGADFVAISPELPDTTVSLKDKYDLAYPLLFDRSNQVAGQYGLVYRMTDDQIRLHKAAGIDLAALNGDDSWQLPMPGTFVVDAGGLVVFAKAHIDYSRRAEPQAVLTALADLRRPVRAAG